MTEEDARSEPGVLLERFVNLFRGNERSSGRHDLKRDRAFTEPTAPATAHFKDHLNGEMGLGVVPIMDDNNCWWAAIDIDNHDSDEDLPIAAVDAIIREKGMPLIACRSKSGGIHCYVFCAEPLPASRVRASLTQWAELLGYGGSEIFPKQARLGSSRDGKLQLGNWINLPYFDAHHTIRYAYRDGAALSLQDFLDLADRLKVTKDQMRGLALAEHPDAPPCVQKMIANGVAQGVRNEALYNVVVYLKRADPATAEARAIAMNATLFSKPLPKSEAARTIASALRPDYIYRCGEEPVRSLCDREACLKQKCGITLGDAERLVETEMLPTFSDLVKYMTEPIRWEIKIDNVRVLNLGTPTLLDWRMMREIIADRLTKIVPMIKAGEWERMLQPLMAEARIIETPDDASINGVVRDRLREFAAKTDLINRGENREDRKALLRGLPIVQVHDGERCVMFRGQDFVNYLKRTKSEELKGANLWFAVKEIGVEHTRVRVNGKENINVWYLPVRQVMHNIEIEAPKFESEL